MEKETNRQKIERRKRLLYELLENVPAGFVVHIKQIVRFFNDEHERMDESTLITFISNHCTDIYEGMDGSMRYLAFLVDHEFSREPDDMRLLELTKYYRRRGKRK